MTESGNLDGNDNLSSRTGIHLNGVVWFPSHDRRVSSYETTADFTGYGAVSKRWQNSAEQ